MGIWHAARRGVLRSAKAMTEFNKIGKPAALGREPPQNSQDNPDENSDKPVIVRYTWGVLKDFEFAKKILPKDPWIDHVTHPNNHRIIKVEGLHRHIQEYGMPFLLVEDFNTTGLRGDAFQMHPIEDDEGNMDDASEKNNVIWFLRAIDVSTPMKGRGGSHGIGKMSFPASSKVSTMFVVTSRDDSEAPRFLSGMTFLENRIRFGTAYGPEMYYCEKCPIEEANQHSWIPITDDSEIEEFCSTLGIERPVGNKGTSVMIPFPDDSLTPEAIEMSLIANYAVPISHGQVVFEIRGIEE
jgi:hypothetical protein